MKRLSLFLCLSILAISQFAMAADEVKKSPADPPKVDEKAKAVTSDVKIGSVDLPQG